MLDPPPPVAAISLAELITLRRQYNQMREALRALSEQMQTAGCNPDATASMQAMIRRALGE
jgi:hypothetical protein